eukprot:SAG11_NODE_16254_length_553_cov_0.718062_1_plen_122_part_10
MLPIPIFHSIAAIATRKRQRSSPPPEGLGRACAPPQPPRTRSPRLRGGARRWAFNIASVEVGPTSPQINFGYGGHQEARGWGVTAESHFYVENIRELLDQEGEWYHDEATDTLYLWRNASQE